jgi:MFS family permease
VRFGLVPTILAHFLYDLSLISSVLFASEALVDQGVIVLVGAVPLAVILWARRGGRGVADAPEWAYNRAWTLKDDGPARGGPPDSAVAPLPGEPDAFAPRGGEPIGDGRARWDADGRRRAAPRAGDPPPVRIPLSAAPVAGILGATLWLLSLVIGPAPERLRQTRGEAVAIATAELERLGFDLDGWTASAVTGDGRAPAHGYVLEEAGPEAYEALDGAFLAPPQWIVRFIDWEAVPEERIEEFLVNVGPSGTVRRVAHNLPEARPGARLLEDSARALVRAALPPGSWDEIGAEETRHEGRTDWTFTFRAPDVLSDVAGEGRARVTVLGDEVTDVRRYVQVPEQWQREQREEDSRRTMISLGLTFALVLLFGAGAVTAIVVWSRHSLETEPLWKATALTFTALAISLANAWPSTTAVFSTAQPHGFQQTAAAVGFVLLAIVVSAGVGLVVALAHSWAEPERNGIHPGALGIGIGLAIAGIVELIGDLVPGVPTLPDYSGASALVPMLAAPFDSVVPFTLATAALTALAVAHRRFTRRPMLHSVTSFAILALGVVAVPGPLRAPLLMWVVGAALAATLVWLVVRLVGVVPAVAPALVATVVVAWLLEAAWWRPFPGSMAGALLAVGLVAVLGWVWSRELERV